MLQFLVHDDSDLSQTPLHDLIVHIWPRFRVVDPVKKRELCVIKIAQEDGYNPDEFNVIISPPDSFTDKNEVMEALQTLVRTYLQTDNMSMFSITGNNGNRSLFGLDFWIR